MVTIEAYIDGAWAVVHDPSLGDETRIVGNGKVVQAVNEIDSLVFDMYPNHALYDGFEPRVTKVRATDGDVVEFEGRVIGVTPDMDATGVALHAVTCESAEAYLLDTLVDTSTLIDTSRGSVTLLDDGSYMMDGETYFRWLISEHNSRCFRDTDERIAAGSYTPSGLRDVYVPWTYGTVTLDALRDLVKQLSTARDDDVYMEHVYDMALYVHRVNGTLTADIIPYDGMLVDTVGRIELGSNMGTMTMEPDYTDIVSTIRPLGDEYRREASYTDSQGVTHTWEEPYRLTMSDYLTAFGESSPPDVSGLYYYNYTDGTIMDNDTFERYGSSVRPLLIEGLSEASDEEGVPFVITRDNALRFFYRCYKYLRDHRNPTFAVSVTAYDLSLLGMDMAAFRLHDHWLVSNILLQRAISVPIVRRTLDLSNPAASTVELGCKAPRDSDYTRRLEMGVSGLQARTEGATSRGYDSALDDNVGPSPEQAASAEGGDTPGGDVTVEEHYHKSAVGLYMNRIMDVTLPANSTSVLLVRVPINTLKTLAMTPATTDASLYRQGSTPGTATATVGNHGEYLFDNVGIYLEDASVIIGPQLSGQLTPRKWQLPIGAAKDWKDASQQSGLGWPDRPFLNVVVTESVVEKSCWRESNGTFTPCWVVMAEIVNNEPNEAQVYLDLDMSFGYDDTEITPAEMKYTEEDGSGGWNVEWRPNLTISKLSPRYTTPRMLWNSGTYMARYYIWLVAANGSGGRLDQWLDDGGGYSSSQANGADYPSN